MHEKQTKTKDLWLDSMPNKDLVWHGLYDQQRNFQDEVSIAMEIEVSICRRLAAIEKLHDESQDVVNKLLETKFWLEKQLQ